MIARTWRGVTREAKADQYLNYLKETGVKEYAATEGNRGVMVLRRVREGRAEFVLISLWDSPEAVRKFAGDDAERAVFYPEDEDYLLAWETRVEHHEVTFDSRADANSSIA